MSVVEDEGATGEVAVNLTVASHVVLRNHVTRRVSIFVGVLDGLPFVRVHPEGGLVGPPHTARIMGSDSVRLRLSHVLLANLHSTVG